MKTICVVIGSRANYSSIKSAMRAIRDHTELDLKVVVGASAVLDRWGQVEELIIKDGFEISERIFMLVEGETPATMAKSTGLGLIELPSVLERLKPDFVVTVGDRFETMATTLAAAYMNIPVAHTMGGEVSGTIDESIRHAVTKFAHVHFPASAAAAERIVRLGERCEDVHNVGCPRIDLVAEILDDSAPPGALEAIFSEGVGEQFNLDEPFLLISQHPVTTEYGRGEAQISATLEAARRTNLPAIILWPNADAGSEDIARGMRKWRESGFGKGWHFFKNLSVKTYVQLMRKTACLVGNSSSGIREGAFIGTPCVNIGTRQTNRERGRNVRDCLLDTDPACINEAILEQLRHGRYSMDPIYGDGKAGPRIAGILADKTVSLQKQISY